MSNRKKEKKAREKLAVLLRSRLENGDAWWASVVYRLVKDFRDGDFNVESCIQLVWSIPLEDVRRFHLRLSSRAAAEKVEEELAAERAAEAANARPQAFFFKARDLLP